MYVVFKELTGLINSLTASDQCLLGNYPHEITRYMFINSETRWVLCTVTEIQWLIYPNMSSLTIGYCVYKTIGTYVRCIPTLQMRVILNY